MNARPWLACALLLVAAPLAAETAYVIDKLLVGVHADKARDSAILKVLPTGTRLEVLKREGEIALVKDPAGVEGWVDASYLMADEPAAARVEALQQQAKALEAALARAEARTAGAAAGGPPGDPSAPPPPPGSLAAENAELQKRLASERLRVGELQARVSSLEAAAAASGEDPERATLKAQIAAVQERLDAAVALGGAPPETALQELAAFARRLLRSKPLAVVVLLLVAGAFVAGVVVMDYLQRKRHGGFRV